MRIETASLLLAAVALPFIGAPMLAFAGRRLGRRVAWMALAFPLFCVSALGIVTLRMNPGSRTVIEFPWIPSLGVNGSFVIDGLSLFFGLIVSGVGVLVVFYSAFYLDDHYRHHGRFYTYLILFMGAMLGTVLSDNLMLLFVFWELTSITSFLLIGFLHGEESARVGARQAMLITVATGLLMLAGIILLRQETGTYSLASMLQTGLPFAEHDVRVHAALILIVIGAFGKSAQVPMHFWLPNAMSAPTPVSAYLHSATMVKLGVFLVARLSGAGVEASWWGPLLISVGFATMLLGRVMAFLSHELKAILAFATVSQLGFLIGYYGLGGAAGVSSDQLHILNHVFYKGALFMAAGVVMHATGLKDLRDFGGLFRRMPVLGIAFAIVAAAMAGLPLTTGFISKEAMLVELFGFLPRLGGLAVFATVAALLASAVQVAFSIRLFAGLFLGREPGGMAGRFHAPHPAMQVPVVLLAAAVLLGGLWPDAFTPLFQAMAVPGLNRPAEHLSLWHGFTRELGVSAAVVALGFGLFLIGRKTEWRWNRVPGPLRFDAAFEGLLEWFSKRTKDLTRALRSDQPLDYLPILIASVLAMLCGAIFGSAAAREQVRAVVAAISFGNLEFIRCFVAGLIVLSVLGVVLLLRWTTQLISLSVAGFLICFYFVLYRAPDLALTQILIEVVSLFMVLLLLGRFRRSADRGERTGRHRPVRVGFNVLLAIGTGVCMSALTLMMTIDPRPDRLGVFFLKNTVPLAEGRNAVNTILVDFRGFDTLGEITVLLIAMLGCLGLLMRRKRSPEEYRAGPMGPPGFGTETRDSE